MALERVTIHNGDLPLTGPDGITLLQGSVRFTAPPLVVVPGQDGVFGGHVDVPVVDGVFSRDLIPSNITGENPTGWPYRVDGTFTNAPDWTQYVRLDSGMGAVALADVLTPEPSDVVYLPVPGPAGPQGIQGVKGDTGAQGVQGPQGPPGSGGGGGVVPVWYSDDLDLGVIALHPQSSWVPVPGVVRTVTGVVVGDKLELSTAFLRIGTSMQLDARFTVNGSPGRAISAKDDGVYTQGPEGFAPWYAQTSYDKTTGTRTLTVRAGDISSDGSVTLQMVYQGVAIPDDGSHHLYFGVGYLGVFDVKHWPVGAR